MQALDEFSGSWILDNGTWGSIYFVCSTASVTQEAPSKRRRDQYGICATGLSTKEESGLDDYGMKSSPQ